MKCFQGRCMHMVLLSIQLANYYSAAITWVRQYINNYPYPPVEAQTRAPLFKRTWTHSGRLWRAAKCNGVAPPASLMFTNLANPLPMPFYVRLNFNHHRERQRDRVKKDQPRICNRGGMCSGKNGLKAVWMAIVCSVMQTSSSIQGIKHQNLTITTKKTKYQDLISIT